jgi:hypothetical protein
MRHERGVSYIDVLIAITILLVGVLALGAALTAAVVRASESQEQLEAKQYASSTIEAIFAARDIETLGFAAAKNVANGGVFLDGEVAIRTGAGDDGIVGTADDDGDTVEGYTREVRITDIEDGAVVTLRQIDVTIYYTVGAARREETISTYISDYTQFN